MKLPISIATLVALAVPATSWAFELGANDTPFAYAQRGLTLKQGQIRIDAGPPDFALLDSGFRNQGRSLLRIQPREFSVTRETFINFGFGGAYGILDELEVGTLFLPVQLSPSFEYLDMEFYGRWKFLTGNFELAAQAAISLPTNTVAGNTDFGLIVGAPAILRLSESMRLDVGIELEMILGDSNIVNLDIPAAFQFQIGEAFFVGPKAGIFFADFSDIWIGIGGVGGFTIATDKGTPMIDILVEIYWPTFFASGPAPIDAVNLDQVDIVFGARLFFSMFPSNASAAPPFAPATQPPPDEPPPETDF